MYCESDVLYKKCLKLTMNIVIINVIAFVPLLSKVIAINWADPA
jgi:hypothetical protein